MDARPFPGGEALLCDHPWIATAVPDRPINSAGDERPAVEVRAEEDDSGARLDQFLADRFPNYSRTQLRRSITSGDVLVNQRTRKPSFRVNSGDVVQLRIPEPIAGGPEPEDIPLDILFEDEHLIAVNKPIGMVVHPAKGHWQGTLTAALAFHFKNLSTVGGAHRPGIVHRLDRDTSGVILVAKNDVAHNRLAAQFEHRTIEKEYLAIGRGTLDRDRDIIDQPIGVHPYQREKMAIRRGHPTSRDAITYYEVTARHRRFVALRVLPKTGRTHQIRVHLAHIGCPVACDPLYSGSTRVLESEFTGKTSDTQVVLARLALHAHRIRFTHPATEETIEIVADVPAELLEFVDRFAG